MEQQTTMDTVIGALPIIRSNNPKEKKTQYVLEPQGNLTVKEISSILVTLSNSFGIVYGQDFLDILPEKTRRHFKEMVEE